MNVIGSQGGNTAMVSHGVESHESPTYEVSEHQGTVIVRPSGTLTIRTSGQVRDFLLKCVADQPRGVIVDLHSLTITRDYLATVFVTVWIRTAQWATVPLAIVPGPANAPHFQHSPIRRFLTVHTTVSAALERLDELPPCRRAMLWLPPSARSVPAAREFATEICQNWQIDSRTDDAVAVVGELVAHVVAHSGSPASLRLELWHGRLTVAVADDDPRPVRWPSGPEADPAAGGLHVAVRLSRARGCSPTHSGGKIVWAVLGAQTRS